MAGKLQSYLHLFYVGKYVAWVYRGYFQYLWVEIIFLQILSMMLCFSLEQEALSPARIIKVCRSAASSFLEGFLFVIQNNFYLV